MMVNKDLKNRAVSSPCFISDEMHLDFIKVEDVKNKTILVTMLQVQFNSVYLV